MPLHGVDKLNAKLDRLMRILREIVPKRMAGDAEYHYKESFRNQGFTDSSLVKWRPTKKGKPGRVLKASGALMNSIKATAVGLTIRVVAGGQHAPYAKLHNEGGTIQRQVTRRAHIRKAHKRRTRRGTRTVAPAFVRRHQSRMNVHMPKRQFIGPSAQLRTKMKTTILRTVADWAKS